MRGIDSSGSEEGHGRPHGMTVAKIGEPSAEPALCAEQRECRCAE
jgi:hypothetical protein